MPKSTFFNLPEEKRDQIVQVALEEFADHDYASVSISRIVARAGIAKGSFYQYFAGKADLLHYLMDRMAEAKTRMLSLDRPDPHHVGVFAYLRWLLRVSATFELANPLMSRAAYRIATTAPEELMAPHLETAFTFYKQLVALGKEQGDIAPEIDDDLAAFLFTTFLTEFTRYLIDKIVAVHGSGWQGKQAIVEFPEFRRLFEQALWVLEHGLAAHPDGTGTDGIRLERAEQG